MRSIPLWVKLLGGIALVAAACVGLSFVPTGTVAYAPNAPISLDGRISVGGTPISALQGRMYLVGVTERPVNLLQRILLDVADPDVDFGPAPEGRTSDAPAPGDVRSMDEAKQVAAGIAFDLAGERVEWRGTGATVNAVAPNGPAARLLEAGDIIVRVNGVDVDTSVEASRIINRQQPGAVIRLAVQRAGRPVLIRVATAAPRDPDSMRTSEIGVELSTIGLRVLLPRNVSIDSGQVVGPSAGLAFSLYLFDALDEVDLLRGRHVVVTGSVAPDGTVLGVGRIRQKALATQAARRELLLVPVANAAEARAALAARCTEEVDCATVVPVRSVQDAVDLLKLGDVALGEELGKR